MKIARAKIEWMVSEDDIPPVIEKEKRKNPNGYGPIIVFQNQYENTFLQGNIFTETMWSSVIFNEEIEGQTSISAVTYLMDNAPFEFMIIGAEFELYEGARKVAVGKIIEKII